MKISAVIISLNEEHNIAAVVESVDFADEVVVVDSGSTDKTREIAESLGARVLVNPWPGFSAQKQFATDAAENDWILSLDADEKTSPILRSEILDIMHNGPAADGYRIPRLSYYLGRAIRHGGWYPDHQLRFFNRQRGRWNGRVIHESVQIAPGATVGTLKGEIIHHTVASTSEHARMIQERYAPLAAEQMLNDGRRSSRFRAAASGLTSFVRSYFFRLGILDGYAGFCIAYFAARHNLLKHRLLIDLQRKARPDR